MDDLHRQLDQHYSQALNPEALLAAVDRHLGSDLPCKALAPVDQLHIGGRGATLKLLQESGLQSGMRVLDIGCGTGGSTRLLADEFGCQAHGLDLTADFCRLAQALNQRLARPVDARFLQGNALSLPFAEASFDALLLQHCLMNLPDPAKALQECYRVLKPGGCLLVHEVLQGPGGEPHYPVPWADGPGRSFLISEQQFKGWLENGGFKLDRWQDESKDALSWRKHQGQREKQATFALSPQLIFGSIFSTMAKNLVLNLEQQRIRVIALTCIKPKAI